ncbi:MAG TPA: phosphoglycerate kinase [Candidatus Nitrosotalea sp.]|nr:phosphoglycerate kinase [Candidatus Nitrosotalea sp.]
MKASIRTVAVTGKRVLVREDLNVPLTQGRLEDDSRLVACLPTLRDLSERGARVVIASHLGRPAGKPEAGLSLRPVAERLSQLLGLPVGLAQDCVGPAAEAAVAGLEPGQLVLLENVRFHPGEEADEPEFARALADLADVFVNDAFGTSHRAHASVVGVARHLPAYAGDLMLAELEALHRALDQPQRPLVAIVGGAKISSKLGVLSHLLPCVDRLLVVGAMSNTFFLARGLQVGSSLVESDLAQEAREVSDQAGDKLVLPVDAICAEHAEPGAATRVLAVDAIPAGWSILDSGPASAEVFRRSLQGAATVVWNGPPGMFEIAEFRSGTRLLAEAVIASGAYSLVGGGDTDAAVKLLGLSPRFSHVSTGGGATLEYMEGRELPGVAILREADATAEVV